MSLRLFGHCSQAELFSRLASLSLRRVPFARRLARLTARENHPDEVHEEVISPEVQKLRSRVCDLRIVVIEHAGCVVEDQTVDLANTDDDLERMAERVRICDEKGYNEADRPPCKLPIDPSN
jgi:hypothetical protein